LSGYYPYPTRLKKYPYPVPEKTGISSIRIRYPPGNPVPFSPLRSTEANPEKIAAITNMGPIKDLKGAQRVMGCLAALSRFISRLGERGLPLYRLLRKTGAGAGLLFISPLGKHLRYVLRLHFPASNNVAEYEALVNGLRIAIELGVRRLDARGDSQLVIDQVMKNSHCRDPKMEAYCDEVRRLEDKFYGLELNHIARRYNETADELAKIASGRTTVPPDVFSRDLHQPSVKIDDTPEPGAPSAQPEAPSAPEGEALRVEEEQNGVPPNRHWQTPYLQYLHRGELPLDRAEARRLARRAKSFVLLGDGKELYHRSPSGILQRCIPIAEGQELLQEIHSGACGHHAAPRALVGNAF
jgi:ribonuclease HI